MIEDVKPTRTITLVPPPFHILFLSSFVILKARVMLHGLRPYAGCAIRHTIIAYLQEDHHSHLLRCKGAYIQGWASLV